MAEDRELSRKLAEDPMSKYNKYDTFMKDESRIEAKESENDVEDNHHRNKKKRRSDSGSLNILNLIC